MEPISIVVLSAALGGVAGKFVEKAWDSGEKWIQSYFKDHGQIAQETATANTMEFLTELANKVKKLEESNVISKEKIESAQDHPDFSALLQKALLTSAQTNSKDKHIVLARLVSERLKSEPESVLALGSKMACDAIAYITVNQMMILGLAVNFYGIRPSPNPPLGTTKENFQLKLENWLTPNLKHYEGLECKTIDITHLESLSCLKVNTFIGRDINDIYRVQEYSFDFDKLSDTKLKESIKKAWEDGLQKVDLTTVGQIIGVSVSDLLTNTTTTFQGWS